MKDPKSRIYFIKDVEITSGKIDTLYSALNNETEKYGVVESLSRFRSDGASVMIGHKKVASKLNRDNTKIIAIHCQNYSLVLAT